MVLHLRIVDVPGRVGPFVGVRPAQRHVANTQAIKLAQQPDVIFDGMPAFDAHQGGQLFLLVSAFDVLDREGHHHAIRMSRSLLVYRVDQVHRMVSELSLE